jgi:hypothetical protein
MLISPVPYLEQIPESRRQTKNRKRWLSDILRITLHGVLADLDDGCGIAGFGRSQEMWRGHSCCLSMAFLRMTPLAGCFH